MNGSVFQNDRHVVQSVIVIGDCARYGFRRNQYHIAGLNLAVIFHNDVRRRQRVVERKVG